VNIAVQVGEGMRACRAAMSGANFMCLSIVTLGTAALKCIRSATMRRK
jgi:hypothetical protein